MSRTHVHLRARPLAGRHDPAGLVPGARDARRASRSASSAGPGSSSATPSRSACRATTSRASSPGEPLVVTRGEGGALHALSNVCRHRAGPVARGAGHRKTLQCGYHGWTYELDGQLRATPEWDGVRGFEKARHVPAGLSRRGVGPVPLREPRCAGAAARRVRSARSRRRPGGLPLEHMRLFKKVDYEVACNWKVYVDNYLEGYHIPIVHPGLFRELDYRAYRVETGALHSKQHAPIRSHAEESLYRRNLPEEARPEALYYWLFPNMMWNLYPDNLQTNVILPLGPERTLTRFEWYVLDPESPGVAEEFAHSFAFSDQVQKEDIEICEAVQRGLRSRTYRAGRYSVLRENGVHHFHGLLDRFLRKRRVGGHRQPEASPPRRERIAPIRGLRRAMGLWDVTFFFVLAGTNLQWVATAAAAGPSSVAVWVIGFFAMFVPLVYVVVGLSSRYPQEGGLYVWSKIAFGDFAGFPDGLDLLVEQPAVLPRHPLLRRGQRPGRRRRPLEGAARRAPSSTWWPRPRGWRSRRSSTCGGSPRASGSSTSGRVARWLATLILIAVGVGVWWRFGSANAWTPEALVPGFRLRDLDLLVHDRLRLDGRRVGVLHGRGDPGLAADDPAGDLRLGAVHRADLHRRDGRGPRPASRRQRERARRRHAGRPFRRAAARHAGAHAGRRPARRRHGARERRAPGSDRWRAFRSWRGSTTSCRKDSAGCTRAGARRTSPCSTQSALTRAVHRALPGGHDRAGRLRGPDQHDGHRDLHPVPLRLRRGAQAPARDRSRPGSCTFRAGAARPSRSRALGLLTTIGTMVLAAFPSEQEPHKALAVGKVLGSTLVIIGIGVAFYRSGARRARAAAASLDRAGHSE